METDFSRKIFNNSSVPLGNGIAKDDFKIFIEAKLSVEGNIAVKGDRPGHLVDFISMAAGGKKNFSPIFFQLFKLRLRTLWNFSAAYGGGAYRLHRKIQPLS